MGEYKHWRDDEMIELRDAGEFVCSCPRPLPQDIPLFATYECKICWKPLPRHTQQQG